MLQRCYKVYAQQWGRYGARGIAVCRRWHRFENFLKDMGPKPLKATLERIDNDGNYSPSNCRWATTAEQNRNKSNIRRITFSGKTQSLAAWANEIGVKEVTLAARLDRYRMPLEKALRGEDLR